MSWNKSSNNASRFVTELYAISLPNARQFSFGNTKTASAIL